jgi:hypothetical protein
MVLSVVQEGVSIVQAAEAAGVSDKTCPSGVGAMRPTTRLACSIVRRAAARGGPHAGGSDRGDRGAVVF